MRLVVRVVADARRQVESRATAAEAPGVTIIWNTNTTTKHEAIELRTNTINATLSGAKFYRS